MEAARRQGDLILKTFLPKNDFANKATLKKTSDPLYETRVHEKSFCQLPRRRRCQLYE